MKGAPVGKDDQERCTSFLGFCNKVPQLGWLTQHILILSWFWRLEVQIQGVCRPGCLSSSFLWPRGNAGAGGEMYAWLLPAMMLGLKSQVRGRQSGSKAGEKIGKGTGKWEPTRKN